MTTALTPGTVFGPYRVTALIGAGGMGQVYSGTDVRLKRDVAIKVLPPLFASDADRLARFQREAEALASLNHVNIAQIYGIERSHDTTALAMELVPGETLAERIAKGPISIDEALDIARQIAEALEAAHARGIVHRDLKPANVKLTPEGTVKVLDFGIAKALDTRATGAPVAPAATQTGVVLGTPAYMSPEQARGKSVDERADIWAFGCVLYEMLAGRTAFNGEDVTLTPASLRESGAALDALTTVPPAVRRTIKLCLEADVRKRIHHIADARLALEGAFDTGASLPATGSTRGRWRRVLLVGAAAVVASSTIAVSLTWVAMRQPQPRVSRLEVLLTGSSEVTVGYNDRDLAITPDGSRLLFVGNRATQIFVRALDALAPVAVFTGQPRGLFMSHDGQWIGFRDGAGTLKKVRVSGGQPVTLARLDAASPGGATWGPDDTIILASESTATGLQRVSSSGGSVEVLTRPDPAQGELDHLWPEMLPGGGAVLFTITALTGGLGAAQVAILDLETGQRRVLLRGGSHAQYVPSGHLVYGQAGTLQAVAFDLARREIRGIPTTVVPDVVTSSTGGVHAVVARDGTLAYLAVGSQEGSPRTLVWVDRRGDETEIGAPPRPYFLPALSPDGTRVSVFANDQENDLWLWDLARATLTRLTLVPGRDALQVWTPDSRRVIFSSERFGGRSLFWQAADGTGTAEQLLETTHTQYPMAVSPDGRQLIFSQETAETDVDLMALELDGTRRVTPLLQSRFTERNGALSPDGRWLAYEANDSGQFEIYVRPYPNVDSGLSVVSDNGGVMPIWTRDGRELIYVSPTGALMRVEVAAGSSWSATRPSVVVKEGYFTNPSWWGRSYDVSPDAQRFLMIKEGGPGGAAPPTSVVVVQQWFEELKRLVPTN